MDEIKTKRCIEITDTFMSMGNGKFLYMGDHAEYRGRAYTAEEATDASIEIYEKEEAMKISPIYNDAKTVAGLDYIMEQTAAAVAKHNPTDDVIDSLIYGTSYHQIGDLTWTNADGRMYHKDADGKVTEISWIQTSTQWPPITTGSYSIGDIAEKKHVCKPVQLFTSTKCADCGRDM